MLAIVGEEWRHMSGGVLGIVISEFSQRKDVKPVVLLMVAENLKVLL